MTLDTLGGENLSTFRDNRNEYADWHEVDETQNVVIVAGQLIIPQLPGEEFDKLIERSDIPQEWYEEEEDYPF